jgi:CheY-like chemotaxis protein
MDSSMRSLKILIIEDNQDFVFLLSSLLETMGHNCIPAFDGMEGINKAKELKPDVIFCDIGLPIMDGFEVAQTIKADDLLKDIHIVAITGYAGQRDLDNAAESGFSYYIAKPVGMNEIKQILTYFTCPESDLNFSDVVSKSRWSVKGTCLYCSHCLPCTSDIDITAINKLVDSLKNNKDIDILKAKYNELKNKASSCVKCGKCEKRCPFDVAITTKMKIAAQMFESE